MVRLWYGYVTAYGKAGNDMVQYGTVTLWYGMVLYGMACHAMLWYGTVRYCTVRCGAVCCGAVWCGYGIVQYSFTAPNSPSKRVGRQLITINVLITTTVVT